MYVRQDVEKAKTELKELFDKVCKMYGVDPEQVKGSDRIPRHIDARQVFSIIANHNRHSYLQIGKFLGIDHSSVQYYCKRRHRTDENQRIINSMTDDDTMIENIAERLSDDPGDPVLQTTMLRLLLNYKEAV